MSRILALTDGVFAFSLTLLVLTLTVPAITVVSGEPASQVSGRLGYLLGQDYGTFVGYVFVFAMVSVWWVAHHRIFRHIVRHDDILVGLNMALLLEIAVMPFVLKVYIQYSFTQNAVILFSAIQIATGLTLSLLWFYASWRHRLIRRTIPSSDVRWLQNRILLTPLVFAASIGVSFVSILGAEIVWVGALLIQRLSWYSEAIRAAHEPRAPKDR
ncbi:MAG: DUF1211 domain-containing protein [Thermoplasmata archaeon]|nr:DUF1211 domain-containing protein [Thermoplasmata archaeon]